MNSEIEIEGISKSSDHTWKVLVNGRGYSVDDIGLGVIKQLASGEASADICESLSREHGQPITVEEVEVIRTRLCRPKVKGEYIKCKLELLDLSTHDKLLDILSLLFSPKWMLLVVVLFSITLIYTLDNWYIDTETAVREFQNSPFVAIMYILVSLFVLLVHELGHASAAHRYKVCPKSIGFGWYIFFPVLYTDVTSAWLANRTQRVIIDIGGFYFQTILMLIAIPIAIALSLPNVFIAIFVWDNLFIILYNLNPLFRFDGYWILSDLCGITNLRAKANFAIIEIIRKIRIRQISSPWQYPIYIYIYGLFSYAFVLFFWGGILLMFFTHLSTISQQIQLSPHTWSWDQYVMVFKFITISFTLWFSTRAVAKMLSGVISQCKLKGNDNRAAYR